MTVVTGPKMIKVALREALAAVAGGTECLMSPMTTACKSQRRQPLFCCPTLNLRQSRSLQWNQTLSNGALGLDLAHRF